MKPKQVILTLCTLMITSIVNGFTNPQPSKKKLMVVVGKSQIPANINAAIEAGNESEVIDWIKTNPAHTNAVDRENRSVAMIASMNNQPSLAQNLISQALINLSIKDNKGFTALDYAIIFGPLLPTQLTMTSVSPTFIEQLKELTQKRIQLMEPIIQGLVQQGVPWSKDSVQSLKDFLVMQKQIFSEMSPDQPAQTPQEQDPNKQLFSTTIKFHTDFLNMLEKYGIK